MLAQRTWRRLVGAVDIAEHGIDWRWLSTYRMFDGCVHFLRNLIVHCVESGLIRRLTIHELVPCIQHRITLATFKFLCFIPIGALVETRVTEMAIAGKRQETGPAVARP